MFENLKAFIRHGKQANEIKRHRSFGNGLPMNNRVDKDHIMTNHIDNDNYAQQQYQQQQQQQHHHDQDKLNQEHEKMMMEAILNDDGRQMNKKAIPNDYVYNADDLTQMSTKNTSDVTLINNSGQQEFTNEQIASHLVEEEKISRKQQVKYPKLDNYQVLDQLGEGAFSIVYRAKNLTTSQEVAIKILRKFQMDEAQKRAVLKEVAIMRQLNHPGIVRFIEFIDSDKYYYIVQELVTGGEIFLAIVKYTYLSEDLSRHIIVQVANAIRYLHEEVGIVHRDIKPENLLFYPIDMIPSANPQAKLRRSDDPNSKLDEGEFIQGLGGATIGAVKLADFGLSKQIWEHNTKTPCGTVGYTAPEIVRDERYSKEVDMWAIGCVLYTLLCGFPPFYDERIDVLTEKVAKGEYTFLSPWWDEISNEAKYCVSRLLTVNPDRRYTIDEFLADPWVNKVNIMKAPSQKSAVKKVRANHPIQSTNTYKYPERIGSELYSPAAVALRDAFDVSTAVHRMGEEAKCNNPKQFKDLIEEEEEENEELTNSRGEISRAGGTKTHQNRKSNPVDLNQSSMFELNLGGASILERRKKQPAMIPSMN